MKYIRTKDEIKAYNESCDLSYVYQSIGGIKIADTIEELCDEFVSINRGVNKKPEVINANMFSAIQSIAKYCEVYGAIWTDNGLIYVAKMNDKGELELLWKR